MQHSSTISNAAAPTAQAELPPIRFADSEQDAVAIHQFLVAVAGPQMLAPVDHHDSAMEVWRVVSTEAALMAFDGGKLIGTMGVIAPKWWYSKQRFMTDRWHFVLPEYKHSALARELFKEALRLANEAGLRFIHQGKIRRMKGEDAFLMMPRAS